MNLISLLSKYSLGIFATHKLWQEIVIEVFQSLDFTGPIHVAGFPIELYSLTLATVSAILTFIGILFLRRTPINRYIM